jgi:hypothetical protein
VFAERLKEAAYFEGLLLKVVFCERLKEAAYFEMN